MENVNQAGILENRLGPNRRAKIWLAGVAAAALMLLAAACGGNSNAATAVPEQTSAENGAAVTEVANRVAATDAGELEGVDAASMALVAAQEAVMTALYQKALPSVVHIQVSDFNEDGLSQQFPGIPNLPEDFLERGEGSGFVWDNEGHIVTNRHVVTGANRVIVTFADRTQVEAEVLGEDPDSDLAVLKLQSKVDSAEAVKLTDSSDVQVGQLAVAIGAPFGQQFTMTSGIVSAVGRTIRSGASTFTTPEVIQTDAPINPGNSGGPLFDRQGRVMGINTQIISRSGSNAGVGLAIPINIAKQVVPALIKDGKYEYAWLGISGASIGPDIISLTDLPEGTQGALVLSVNDGGPAHEAGISGSDRTVTVDGIQYALGGDTIVGINGNSVRDMTDLIVYLTKKTRPGDTVTLEIIHEDGESAEVEVTLGKRPS